MTAKKKSDVENVQAEPVKSKYRVAVDGTAFDGVLYKAGDEVELTEAVAKVSQERGIRLSKVD